MKGYLFREAKISELDIIWGIFKSAIKRRKEDGSNQWQDGYPNLEVLKKDIEKGEGFVVVIDNTIAGYTAILINDEPAYSKIEGKWLTNTDFVVFHRVAISDSFHGLGLARKIIEEIEAFALNNNIFSVKADTNHDNFAMLHIFNKMGYRFCGKVYFRGSPRNAYEKVLLRTI